MQAETHLPLQLHWSLEYWETAIRQRIRTDSKNAKNGESMFVPPSFLPNSIVGRFQLR